MADWEDAVLSNRHIHNRVGKFGRGKGGKSGGAFDVQKSLGTYEIKCPAATKLLTTGTDTAQPAKLEIYTLNNSGNALIAELFLPNALHATVLLAGSRKTMNTVVRDLQAENDGPDEENKTDDQAATERSDGDQVNEGESGQESAEDSVNDRVRNFEKNSFRSPKFWLRWQGQLLQSTVDQPHTDVIEDSGYLIFSGNNCDKFQGTISCEQLGWDNVKISGWKTASRSARDFAVQWHKSD